MTTDKLPGAIGLLKDGYKAIASGDLEPEGGAGATEMTDAVNVPREWVARFVSWVEEWKGTASERTVDEMFSLYTDARRFVLAAAPKAEPVRWTEDMERESRESDYERGFRDGQLSHPEAPKVEQEPVGRAEQTERARTRSAYDQRIMDEQNDMSWGAPFG